MAHKVENTIINNWMKDLGRAACRDLTPYTLITPFRVTPLQRNYFPKRQSFVFDGSVNEVYQVRTSDTI